MSDELTQFTKTIQVLRHHHADQHLSQLISKLEPKASASQKFLIKMEIKRLAQPCKRILDFRTATKQTFTAVERAGVTHYLDSQALLEFDREFNNYGQQYCVGVYEHMLRYAKQRDTQSLAESQNKTKRITLARVSQRAEERIYFSTALSVFFTTDTTYCEENKPDMLALTTDISQKAVTVKIEDHRVIIPDNVIIKFAGLEREYLMPRSLYVRYNLYKKYIRDGVSYAVFTQCDAQSATVITECKELIKRCIFNHKRRNRVPVENTVKSIECKIFEQFVAGRQVSLPLLLATREQSHMPVATLSSPDNRPLIEFMTSTAGRSVLPHLIDFPMIQQGLREEDRTRLDFLMVRFRDKNKQLSFAVFSLQQAIEDTGVQQILGRAHAKSGVRLLRLTSKQTSCFKAAHIPSSLPDTVGEAFENLNRAPSGKLKALLAMCTHAAVLEDLTDTVVPLGLDSLWQASQAEASIAFDLRSSLLKKPKHSVYPVNSVTSHGESRVEDRFVSENDIVVKGRKRDNKDEAVNAKTVNLSSRGMLVRCQEPHIFEDGDDVFVSMQLTVGKATASLTQQRYRVVSAEGNDLRLAIAGNIASHDARLFLRDSLMRFADVLQVAGDDTPIYGQAKAMRNIFASLHPQLFVTYARHKQAFYPAAVISSDNTDFPQMDSSTPEHIFINTLCQHETLQHGVKQILKQFNNDRVSGSFVIIARLETKASGESPDFEMQAFVSPADMGQVTKAYASQRKRSKAYVFRVGVHNLMDVSDKYFKDELRYLLKYAKPKHSDCVTLLKRSKVLVDIQDVTSMLDLVCEASDAQSPEHTV